MAPEGRLLGGRVRLSWLFEVLTDAFSGQGVCLGGLAVAMADRVVVVQVVIACRTARSFFDVECAGWCRGLDALGAGGDHVGIESSALGFVAWARISLAVSALCARLASFSARSATAGSAAGGTTSTSMRS